MSSLRVLCRQEDQELHLLAHFANQMSSASVTYEVGPSSDQPRLTADSSTLAEGCQAVSRCLVGQCSSNSRQAVCLLGDSTLTNAVIWQWCDFAQELKFAQTKLPMLEQLSRWLANRNFVATESLSLADLCLYAICYPAVASSNFNFSGLAPLARWIDQVHNTAGVRGVYPDLPLQRV